MFSTMTSRRASASGPRLIIGVCCVASSTARSRPSMYTCSEHWPVRRLVVILYALRFTISYIRCKNSYITTQINRRCMGHENCICILVLQIPKHRWRPVTYDGSVANWSREAQLWPRLDLCSVKSVAVALTENAVDICRFHWLNSWTTEMLKLCRFYAPDHALYVLLDTSDAVRFRIVSCVSVVFTYLCVLKNLF